MVAELSEGGAGLDPRRFSVAEVIQHILPRGHVIHGYSSASSTRMLMVLEARKYSDSAPLFGFGMDGKAERALARALLTYAIREEQGLDYITETQLAESTVAQVPGGGHDSRFDNIVWGADFKLYQEGDTVHASSAYGGQNVFEGCHATASDALGAIIALTDTYRFQSERVRSLPPIALG